MSSSEPSNNIEPAPAGLRPVPLRRRSVIAMVMLTVLTLGFYYPIWFLRRRRGLNALDSPRKVAMWPFLLLLALFIVEFLTGFVSAGRPEQVLGAQASTLLSFSELAVGILVLVQCFSIKDILEDHLRGPENSERGPLAQLTEAKLSGFMTFLFTIFYLQHVINRDLQEPTTSV